MKTVVVTGSTRGIGFGLARQFLARGCRVVINGTGMRGVGKAVDALAAFGPRVHGVVADVSSREAVQRLYDEAAARFSSVDIWVNNAGVTHPQRKIWELDAETVDRVAGINMIGVVNGLTVPFLAMRRQGHGGIFTMEGHGSDGRIIDGMSLYGMSKSAVHYIVKAFAAEAKGSGVTIGALSPGMVVTDLLLETVQGDAPEVRKRKDFFNMLADDVETVSVFLVEKMLAASAPYESIRWLTRRKVLFRLLFGRLRGKDFFRS